MGTAANHTRVLSKTGGQLQTASCSLSVQFKQSIELLGPHLQLVAYAHLQDDREALHRRGIDEPFGVCTFYSGSLINILYSSAVIL